MVEQMCSVLEMPWKCALGFGPVYLVYGKEQCLVTLISLSTVSPLQREPFNTTKSNQQNFPDQTGGGAGFKS